jgi:hypothetical protein
MLVKALFKELSLGELSNLSLSADGSGTIIEEKQGKILLYAQDGLTKLYGRFLLSEKVLILRTIAGQTSYPLESRYAVSQLDDDDEATILDNDEEPFTDDLVKVLAVSQMGDYVPLNDTEACGSVFTPSPTILRVPETGGTFSLVYQANHPKLVDEESVISLPEVLWPALKSFVAGKVYSHMNGQDNMVLSQNHMAEFEGICLDVVDRDLVSTSISSTNSRFNRNGWV